MLPITFNHSGFTTDNGGARSEGTLSIGSQTCYPEGPGVLLTVEAEGLGTVEVQLSVAQGRQLISQLQESVQSLIAASQRKQAERDLADDP